MIKMSERWYPGKFIERIRQKAFFKGLIFAPGVSVDVEIDRMMEEKKKEWRAKGYSESLIRMAEDLALSWTTKMSEAFAPPEVREAVIRHIFPKALETASHWLETIGEAAKRSLG